MVEVTQTELRRRRERGGGRLHPSEGGGGGGRYLNVRCIAKGLRGGAEAGCAVGQVSDCLLGDVGVTGAGGRGS